jgi:UDP-N-acetylglucosamine--N-acetylmuramyl-(pentapeptide) pyrophosphoryl-undecaprenol N-acetylglucosamine transferase
MIKPRVVISGGGTGGHIFPAVAIADEIMQRYPHAEILFVGAKDRMEMERVPQAGYKIVGLWISGIQRKLSFDNLLFPVKLITSLWKAKQLLKSFKPNVVVGTGGFASGPTLKAATKLNLPTLVQEQNSYAGITNKWVAKEATSISVAYENMDQFFPKDKLKLTGNPVRKGIVERTISSAQAKKSFGLTQHMPTVLVIGGSLGARKVNEVIHKYITSLDRPEIQLIWQTGKLYYETYVGSSSATYKILPFINEMENAYAAADIIISRAGAGSVSELLLLGKPVIFIPSPNVAEDHQTKNANALVEKQAAISIPESKVDVEFSDVLNNLLVDKGKQDELGKNIKALAKPNATKDIVDEIEKIWNL